MAFQTTVKCTNIVSFCRRNLLSWGLNGDSLVPCVYMDSLHLNTVTAASVYSFRNLGEGWLFRGGVNENRSPRPWYFLRNDTQTFTHWKPDSVWKWICSFQSTWEATKAGKITVCCQLSHSPRCSGRDPSWDSISCEEVALATAFYHPP